jgi:hypothetical protein
MSNIQKQQTVVTAATPTTKENMETKAAPASTKPLAQMVQPVTPVAKTPDCHSGNVFVFGYNLNDVKVEFYGGGTMRRSIHTADMILLALQSSDYGDAAPLSFKGGSIPQRACHQHVHSRWRRTRLPAGFLVGAVRRVQSPGTRGTRQEAEGAGALCWWARQDRRGAVRSGSSGQCLPRARPSGLDTSALLQESSRD